MAPVRVLTAAADGHALAAYRFDPPAASLGSVVIAPAMGVPQGYYQDFAAWLAEQGYTAWTFDYRGTGQSLVGTMRGAIGDLGDWCRLDYDAMLRQADDALPGRPLFAVGHSFGGQCAPLLPSRHRLSGLVTMAAGSGSMRHNTPRTRRMAPLLWYLLVPMLCPLFGYFPGARLGIIGDVPTGAMKQWRRWCLSPDYLLGAEAGAREAYASAPFPALLLFAGDDELLLASGVQLLRDAYPPGQAEYRLLDPKEFGLARIGHVGFFRAQAGPALWPLVRDWLAQHAGFKASR